MSFTEIFNEFLAQQGGEGQQAQPSQGYMPIDKVRAAEDQLGLFERLFDPRLVNAIEREKIKSLEGALQAKSAPMPSGKAPATLDQDRLMQAVGHIVDASNRSGETPFFKVTGNNLDEVGLFDPENGTGQRKGFSRMPGNIARDYMGRQRLEEQDSHNQAIRNAQILKGATDVAAGIAKSGMGTENMSDVLAQFIQAVNGGDTDRAQTLLDYLRKKRGEGVDLNELIANTPLEDV